MYHRGRLAERIMVPKRLFSSGEIAMNFILNIVILLLLSLFSLQGYCLKYTRRLEAGGKFKLTIWPDHCLIGSDGHAIQKDIQEAVREWDIFHYTKMVKHIHKVKFWSIFIKCNCQAN